MNKIAIVTGASSGIGEATAILLAKNGYNVVITGRRRDRLELVKRNIEEISQSAVLVADFDVRSQKEVEQFIDCLPHEWREVDVLINNAGLAVGIGPINDGIIDDWERMIDTNIKGLLYISREVSKLMIARKSGHIVNIASIAGKEVYPGGNVYCATKHAVDALSKAMRIDLLSHNIKVTNVAPGMVDTEFSLVRFKDDQDRADAVYNGLTPLCGEDIAETILFVLSRPKSVCINDIVVMPTAQASSRDVIREE